MNLQEIFHREIYVRGFTFIELMLVIALVTIIGVFITPIGLSYYHSQLLNETSDGLVSALRQAQSFAYTGRHNHAFGVFVTADAYTVFEGDTYASRITSEDMIFPIASTVTVTGLQEIVFSEMNGTPRTTGIITVVSGNKMSEINILPSGNIEQ